MALASGSSQVCYWRPRSKCQLTQRARSAMGPIVCWLLDTFPAVAVYCLQGALPDNFGSSCLGTLWVKKHVLFRSDNDAVVHILNTRTSRVPCLMLLLRSLLFSAARHSFSFSSQHVPGVSNQLADALSCFNWQEFCRLAPEAQPLPTVAPLELLAELTSPP